MGDLAILLGLISSATATGSSLVWPAIGLCVGVLGIEWLIRRKGKVSLRRTRSETGIYGLIILMILLLPILDRIRAGGDEWAILAVIAISTQALTRVGVAYRTGEVGLRSVLVSSGVMGSAIIAAGFLLLRR